MSAQTKKHKPTSPAAKPKEKTTASVAPATKPNSPIPQTRPEIKSQAMPFLVRAAITAVIRNKAGIEEKRFLTTTFQIDDNAAKMPWYALRNFLVPEYLNRTMGRQGAGWVKIYEIKIEQMLNRHHPTDVEGIPVRVMTIQQLETYVRRWELPVKPSEFHSVEMARQMVALAETDPTGYQNQYAAYMQGKSREYPELDQMRKNLTENLSESLDSEFDALMGGSKTAPSPVNPIPEEQEAPEVEEVEEVVTTGSEPMPQEPAAATDPNDPFSGV